MSLSYLTTQALKGRCFWRREGGKEKTGAAGKKRRKEKPPLSLCQAMEVESFEDEEVAK
ncbi:hypothetical protein POPTR_001G189601v4 [Populus trichocarpa]|uniref:Uncharacterized protein n=1 Tax=Populus trichocarpa TaxID=3694 RepID=A0ACC0TL26_POPTR|nr:hypothetical protein BDE02_01G170800 [Populus trichocarpa]KAI9401916.1 hypothetical protein POPTR_001G189601v4 [Populus trichocarpa]